ncbi:MAG: hypothetical protein ACPG32_15900 [Akkermansiaceae bacterium]
MALEKIDGVTGAYVNKGIILHLANKDGFDKKKVATALTTFKMVIKEAKKLDTLPF